jgi:hypothetical protein
MTQNEQTPCHTNGIMISLKRAVFGKIGK